MERTLSADERIRRAEEVYQRRRNQVGKAGQARVNVSNSSKDYRLGKKLVIQIAICICIYLVFYVVKNSEAIFSENFLEKTKEILSYDINFEQLYSNIKDTISTFTLNQENKIDVAEEINEQSEEKNEIQDNNQNNEVVQEPNSEETIVEEAATLSASEESSSISQTGSDAEAVMAQCSFIKPLEGVITSRFGLRESTSEIVSPFHTGIDIAANTGTVYYSAMDGNVVEVSGEGAYGNHVKIVNGNVSTLYAHSSKIYVKQGDTVKQGQPLGEVGATGNATGPHLHFEIRNEERYVNPDDVLSF